MAAGDAGGKSNIDCSQKEKSVPDSSFIGKSTSVETLGSNPIKYIVLVHRTDMLEMGKSLLPARAPSVSEKSNISPNNMKSSSNSSIPRKFSVAGSQNNKINKSINKWKWEGLETNFREKGVGNNNNPL